jgi:hypothetical protein
MKTPKVTSSQMKRWRKIEMEHTTSPKRAENIVLDHVREHGLLYYPTLIRMEKKLPYKSK